MHTRLIDALARQHYAELHQRADAARLANGTNGGRDGDRTVTSPSPFGRVGNLRARLASLRRRAEPPARPADAFPLWQAAKAGLVRVAAGAEAVGGTIEAGAEAVEETIARAPDKTTNVTWK